MKERKMKELRIGEVFDVNGVVLQVVEHKPIENIKAGGCWSHKCDECFYDCEMNSTNPECRNHKRSDQKEVYFKKLSTRDINYQTYMMQQGLAGQCVERKIGEVFDHNGVVLQVVGRGEEYDGSRCAKCYFYSADKDCPILDFECSCRKRADENSVYFKKLSTRDINYQTYMMQQGLAGQCVERKIGEIFDVNGVVLEVQKIGTYMRSCESCFFRTESGCKAGAPACEVEERSDETEVIFKKLKTADINYKIYVMQQFREGRKIESKIRILYDVPWNDVEDPDWAWNTRTFRLKRQKKYRPYTDQELFELEIGKILFRYDVKYKVKEITKKENCMLVTVASGSGYEKITRGEMLENFTWEDGSPCGVEVEE